MQIHAGLRGLGNSSGDETGSDSKKYWQIATALSYGRGTGVGRGEGGGGTGVMLGGGVGRGGGVDWVTVKLTVLNTVQALKVALNIGKYVLIVVGLPEITPVFVFIVNPGGSCVAL